MASPAGTAPVNALARRPAPRPPRPGAAALRWLLVWVCIAWVLPVSAEGPGRHALATAHPAATAAGEEILRAGGNAFDAAVAVTAALAVVEPFGSGLGGGGFYLLHRAEDGYQTFVDARERAPSAATRDMYLDEAGEVVPDRSLVGPLSAGIPGTPAALEHLALRYGRLPLATSLGPAVRLARDGFEVGERYRTLVTMRLEALQRHPESAAIFLLDGAPPPPGHRLIQRDLAETLLALAGEGAAGFYQGEVGRRLVEAVREAGGIWTAQDLAEYKVVERQPLRARYRDVDIVAAPPPSSGGLILAQSLNILEGWELAELDAVTRAHLVIEALRRAFRDRALLLGDPDFVAQPVRKLSDKGYAAEQRRSIRLDRATPSAELGGGAAPAEGDNTTHFSILDAEGNRVAATLSLNYPFGSGFTAAGTGVLLNDEMDDFSSRPATPNAYGLIGYDANAIAPGKRPLSSMSPTFLEQGGRVGILGTPGGSRIPSMVLLGVLDFVEGHGPASWVALPRYHHQYEPDEVRLENEGLDPALLEGLAARGHTLQQGSRRYGDMQAILWDGESGQVEAASDPRGGGRASVFAP